MKMFLRSLVLSSPLILLMQCVASATTCDLVNSIYSDTERKGFEIRFSANPTSAATPLKATVQHSQYGVLYVFEVGQSQGYGSYYMLLNKNASNIPPERDSFGLYQFAENLISESSLLGFNPEAPYYIFIEGLGAHDYHTRRNMDNISDKSFIGDTVFQYKGCQSS